MFEHLKEVHMTYCEHLLFSLKLSSLFFIGSIKAIVHGMYPDVCTQSSTEIINSISYKIKTKSCSKTTQTDVNLYLRSKPLIVIFYSVTGK